MGLPYGENFRILTLTNTALEQAACGTETVFGHS